MKAESSVEDDGPALFVLRRDLGGGGGGLSRGIMTLVLGIMG